MRNIRGAQVLITGGASGIGRLMAEDCLRRGARRVIIWDKDPTPISDAVRSWVAEGHQVIVKAIDITQTDEVIKAANAITDSLKLCGRSNHRDDHMGRFYPCLHVSYHNHSVQPWI